MGKIISIDDINRAAMEGKDDLVFELCKVFDHEATLIRSLTRRSPFAGVRGLLEQAKPLLQNRGAQDWKTHGTPLKTVCDGTEPLTAKGKTAHFF